jgi:hypothetical protein
MKAHYNREANAAYREVEGVRIPDVISTDAGQIFEVRLEEIHLAPSAPVRGFTPLNR